MHKHLNPPFSMIESHENRGNDSYKMIDITENGTKISFKGDGNWMHTMSNKILFDGLYKF